MSTTPPSSLRLYKGATLLNDHLTLASYDITHADPSIKLQLRHQEPGKLPRRQVEFWLNGKVPIRNECSEPFKSNVKFATRIIQINLPGVTFVDLLHPKPVSFILIEQFTTKLSSTLPVSTLIHSEAASDNKDRSVYPVIPQIWSHVGKQQNETLVRVHDSMTLTEIIHLLLHALGLQHEEAIKCGYAANPPRYGWNVDTSTSSSMEKETTAVKLNKEAIESLQLKYPQIKPDDCTYISNGIRRIKQSWY